MSRSTSPLGTTRAVDTGTVPSRARRTARDVRDVERRRPGRSRLRRTLGPGLLMLLAVGTLALLAVDAPRSPVGASESERIARQPDTHADAALARRLLDARTALDRAARDVSSAPGVDAIERALARLDGWAALLRTIDEHPRGPRVRELSAAFAGALRTHQRVVLPALRRAYAARLASEYAVVEALGDEARLLALTAGALREERMRDAFRDAHGGMLARLRFRGVLFFTHAHDRSPVLESLAVGRDDDIMH